MQIIVKQGAISYVYDSSVMDTIEDALAKVSSKKSNLENAAHKTTLTACKLSDMWAYGTFGNRQKIQNLVFPAGITWNRENLENLTNIENETFKLMRSISDSSKNEGTRKNRTNLATCPV